jgi:serine/threonine protein kinase
MLCGKIPFDHQIEQDKLFEKIVKGDIPSLKSIYPPISEEAEKIVRKAISTDPDSRYSSCDQFKEEIYNLV